MAEFREEWTAPSVVAATFLWLGRIPFAPGTWGAMAGVGVSLATGAAAAGLAGWASRPEASTAIEAAMLVAANLVGIPICSAAARRLGRGSDPGSIVIDEALSLPLGMLVVPFGDRSLPVLVAGWVLHRVFDISKPFPCRRLEHLPGGLGVMADDWAAAAWMAAAMLAWQAAGA